MGGRRSPGRPADLRGDVWTDPRAAHGVAFEDVDIRASTEAPARHGSCPARSDLDSVRPRDEGGSRTEGARALGPAVDAGLPSLLISYRNDEVLRRSVGGVPLRRHRVA